MSLFECQVKNNGDLVILFKPLLNSTRRIWLLLAKTLSEDVLMAKYISEELPIGYEFLTPESVGGLTESPIIGKDVEFDTSPDGKSCYVVKDSGVWWYPDYQIMNPWLELFTSNSVTFTKAEDYD